MVGVLDPAERVDAARYVALARPIADGLMARGSLPVLTAGTGLYLKALLEDLDLGVVKPDPHRRAELEAEAQRDLPALVARLRRLDAAAAAGLDERNPARVVRRLEIALAQPPRVRRRRRPLPAVKVGLSAPRAVLLGWIEARVDRMLARGWRREVEGLVARGINPRAQALSGIGVAELADAAIGGISEAAAREAVIKRTRQYAKRQMTWFRADPGVHWIDVTAYSTSDMVEAIASMVKR
jgi:tRNA dimethylallyltransferase